LIFILYKKTQTFDNKKLDRHALPVYLCGMKTDLFPDNRLCRLLNVRYPIIQAGMVWVSGWMLALAVAQSGGLGVIGAGSMSADVLREHITKFRQASDLPFAVNLPLLYSHIADQIKVIIDHQVPIVITSAGNPATWTKTFQAEGITVLHVVSATKFALKARDAGADAVIAEGFEAGGHNGRDETTTFCLIPAVRQAVGRDYPIAAAGGIATGAGILAAQALGADGVQVGSRFAVTEESSAHEAFKQAVCQAQEGDTMLSLKPLVPVRMLKNDFWKQVSALEAQGASAEVLKEVLGKGRSRKGIFEGDLSAGELEIGQVSALIDRILPASEVMAQLLREYQETKERLCI
jgi:enoyl-[acyl-carrier protein] reductase II